MAGRGELEWSRGFYSLLVHIGFCHPPSPHICLLFACDTQTAHRWSQKQVQREEEVTSEGHQTSADRDYCLCVLLATLLGDPGGPHIHTSQTVPVQADGYHIPHHRMS